LINIYKIFLKKFKNFYYFLNKINKDTVVYFRVIDPRKAAYNLENLNKSVEEITVASTRTICGEHVL
jgi:regulator of protease activity HflC (stomatin/prohibitin superfamily)